MKTLGRKKIIGEILLNCERKIDIVMQNGEGLRRWLLQRDILLDIKITGILKLFIISYFHGIEGKHRKHQSDR